jgi:ATP synthase F1 complex assembly factor 2
MLNYLEGDTLLYFASLHNSLSNEQHRQWTPVIQWINSQYQLDLKPTENPIGHPDIKSHSRDKLARLLLNYKLSALFAINFATEAVKSLILPIAILSQYLDIETAVKMARLEQIYQSRTWGSFEWAHDIEHYELCLRFSSAMLFAHFSSNIHIIKD